MFEVKLFLTGTYPPNDWLYALAKWAHTLKKVAGHFGASSGDFDAERRLVLFAKAPRSAELERLGGCYRDDLHWMRNQKLGAFA